MKPDIGSPKKEKLTFGTRPTSEDPDQAVVEMIEAVTANHHYEMSFDDYMALFKKLEKFVQTDLARTDPST